jgi:hypothetical protein
LINAADSSFAAKFSPEPDFAIEAQNSIEFSKPEILRPDREFESHLVRQLVSCFCKENGRKGIIANYLEVSARKLATVESRKPNLASPGAFSVQLSQGAAARFGSFR